MGRAGLLLKRLNLFAAKFRTQKFAAALLAPLLAIAVFMIAGTRTNAAGPVGQVTATINNVGPGLRGMALAANGRLYVTTANNTVVMVDTATNTVVGNPIPVGALPVAIAYNSSNNRLYVANHNSGSVSVIDITTNAVVATIGGLGFVNGLTFDPANGNIYVADDFNNGSGAVRVIKGTALITSIFVPYGPSDVTFIPSTGTLYSTAFNSNLVGVINGVTNTLATTINVGFAQSGAVFNPANGLVYVHGGGNLKTINPASNAVGAPIGLAGKAGASAFNPDNQYVYVTNFTGNSVSVVDGSSNTVVGTVPVGQEPLQGIVYNPSNKSLYVSNYTSGTVSVISVPPVANAGPDQTQEATSSAGASFTLNGTGSSDPLGGPLSYSWAGPFAGSPASGASPTFTLPPPTAPNQSATYTVTLTVKNSAGVTSTDAVALTVRDTTAPVINGIPGPITTSATDPGGATVSYGPISANDAVDGSRSVLCVPASGSVFPLGTTTVNCTSTDTRANSITASFAVTVVKASTSLQTPIVAGINFVGNNLTVSTVLSRTSAPVGPVAGAVVAFALTGPGGTTVLSATTDASGRASVAFPLTQRGLFSVTASFTGTTVLLPSTSGSAGGTVYQGTSLAMPASISGVAGSPLAISATLTAVPGGVAVSGQSVSFDFGGVIPAQVATTNAAGVAAVTATFPMAGIFPVQGSFLNGAGFFANHLGAITPETASTLVTLTDPTPPFSQSFTTPIGACICTPLLMNTNVAGTQRWYVKAGPTGSVGVTLFAHAVNPTDGENVSAMVYNAANTLVATVNTGYVVPVGTPYETSASTSLVGSAGDIYRIDVVTPGTPPTQPHYRFEFTGAEAVATSSPSSPSFEGAGRTRWLFNTAAREPLNIRLFVTGTPATESIVNYTLIDPTGVTTSGSATANTGLDANIVGAASGTPGTWKLVLDDASNKATNPANGHYGLDKTTGADRGIYLSWRAGFGVLSGAITAYGPPFSGPATVHAVNSAGVEVASQVTTDGHFNFPSLPADEYTVTLSDLPPGWVTPTPRVVFVFCNRTASVSFDLINRLAKVSVVSSPNPSTYGDLVTFQADVTTLGGNPTGTVTFREGLTNLSGPIAIGAGGHAQFSTSSLNAGDHVVTADYSGDDNFDHASAKTTQQVNNASSFTVVTCMNATYTGSALETCAATVTGAGGLHEVLGVTYTENTDAGTATGSAFYGGDANHDGSKGTDTFSIAKASLTVTAKNRSKTYGEAVTFTGSEFSTNGLLTATDAVNSVTLASAGADAAALVAGSAYAITPSAAVGTGLGNYDITYVNGSLSIGKAPTQTTLSAVPAIQAAGQSVTLTATVVSEAPGSGVPDGTVTFTLGATVLGAATVDASGVAVLSTSAIPEGEQSILATYSPALHSGVANYLTSASGSQKVFIYGTSVGGGTFVIGDKSPNGVGAQVNYWGAQWEKTNSLTGGAPNASFRGYAVAPTSPTVGGTFTAVPGNSGHPPASVPSYIRVIVTNKVTKSGSNITGTIVKLVVVRVDSAAAGMGTVVAVQ